MFRNLMAPLFLMVFLQPCWANASCINYQDTITLEGRVYKKTFPGPPNYQKIIAGDRKESYWFIRLTKPICLNKDVRNGYPENVSIKKISVIQIRSENEIDFRRLKQIKSIFHLVGILDGAITGHDHTKVILDLH